MASIIGIVEVIVQIVISLIIAIFLLSPIFVTFYFINKWMLRKKAYKLKDELKLKLLENERRIIQDEERFIQTQKTKRGYGVINFDELSRIADRNLKGGNESRELTSSSIRGNDTGRILQEFANKGGLETPLDNKLGTDNREDGGTKSNIKRNWAKFD